MFRFAAMSWIKTAVICLCIIGGFVGHSYMDRYYYMGGISTPYGRIDKWTGKYMEWNQGFENFAKQPGNWEVPGVREVYPTQR